MNVCVFVRKCLKCYLLNALSASLLFSTAFFSPDIHAQDYHDFGFQRVTDVVVYGYGGKDLDLAWTGGLNSAQFHKFDLNFNGIEDLIIFDRHGNRLLTFMNNGSSGEEAYSFAPEYIDFFPAMHHWVQFIDFNNNGKKDIFTYTTGGIKVFRNISDTSIKFEQATFPFLRSLYGNIETNLFVTNVDYPAITDMDGDGDLDILTFWVLTTFVEMHTNNSVELYGHSDSLVYVKTDYCWGRFAECEESNQITLDTCVNFRGSEYLRQKHDQNDFRHAGSTLLMLDMTGNGLKDLILGDTDYPTLFLLTNEGTQEEAYITGLDTLFPSNTRPVNLFSMPAAFFIDISNNGIKDLVVSPFDASLRKSRHHNSVWFYRNTGTNELPVFEFEREDLFQHRMIDVGAGAMPVLTDIDNDGLPDLFIGNFGYNDTCYFDQFLTLICKYTSSLAYYRNSGSPGNPEFSLITNDFAGLSALGLRAIYPAFGDIDGDGKPEMIIGNENGNLFLFKDNSTVKGSFAYELIDNNFQQIDVSGFSKPQLIDLNGNGLLDLVVGGQNGKIAYYENQGTISNPVFIKITDELGEVNVTDPMASYTGHSAPHFFLDAHGHMRLFVGSESGRIFYFKDIEGNLDGIFTLAEERLLLINEGIRSAPFTAFLTNTDFPDMITGNYGGGLSFYKGSEPKPFGINSINSQSGSCFKAYPNPVTDNLTISFLCRSFRHATLSINDLAGRIIYHRDIPDDKPMVLSIDNWEPGLFIITVEFDLTGGEYRIERQKVIVIR